MAGRIESIGSGPAKRVPDVIAITRDLVKIPSHEGTAGIGAYVKEFATAYGLSVREIPTTNPNGSVDKKNPSYIVGRGDFAKQPRVLGMSHIDTVNPWLTEASGMRNDKGGYTPAVNRIADGARAFLTWRLNG